MSNLLPGERIDELQRNGYRIIQESGNDSASAWMRCVLSGFARAKKQERCLDSGLWKRDHSDPDGSKDRGKTFYRTGDPAGECGYGETQRGVEWAAGSDRHRRR